MRTEAELFAVTPERAGLRPDSPLEAPQALSRKHRFLTVPMGMPHSLPGVETQITGLNIHKTERKQKKQHSLHNEIGKDSYNPRKRGGYRDRNGKWIVYRRGGRGGRCARIPHDSPDSCPTRDKGRCQKKNSPQQTENQNSGFDKVTPNSSKGKKSEQGRPGRRAIIFGSLRISNSSRV